MVLCQLWEDPYKVEPPRLLALHWIAWYPILQRAVAKVML